MLISIASGPVAVKSATCAATDLPRGDTSIQRFRLATTSSALRSRPLWSLTPLRSVMLYSLPSAEIFGIDSASIGTSAAFASNVNSGS